MHHQAFQARQAQPLRLPQAMRLTMTLVATSTEEAAYG
jgi:hypothetical protein